MIKNTTSDRSNCPYGNRNKRTAESLDRSAPSTPGAGLLRFTAKGIHEVIAHSLTHLCASGRVPSHACTSNMSATLIGASLGFGMQLYINALRKLPLLR